MTDLGDVLARLGLSQYLGRLIDEGFEKWETVLDITEPDLASLNFKLGHRRILQREIASSRGVSPCQALSFQYYHSEDLEPEEKFSPKPSRTDPGKGIAPTGKRKYRRHPKPDEHAPEKPPSAYVMFANRVRDELKGQNLSFTDIAKLVGEKWKVLDPEFKETYEFEASVAKEKYNSELQEYKKTDSYKDYVQYLSEFKSKTTKEVGKDGSDQSEALRKRPKLESISSSGSGGAGVGVSNSSTISGVGIATPTAGLGRGSSISLNAPISSGPGVYVSSPATATATAAVPSHHSSGVQSAPPATIAPRSPTPTPRMQADVARYNDAVVQSTQQQQEAVTHPTTTTDAESAFLPRIRPTVQGPHIQQQSSYIRHQPHPMGAQSLRQSGSSFSNSAIRRPSLRHEELISPTTASISSSGSSSVTSVTPMTPASSSFDDGPRSHRNLPSLPPPNPSSSGGGYFDQIPRHHQQQASQSRSPRSFSHQNFPPPTPLAHPTHSYHPQQTSRSQASTPTPLVRDPSPTSASSSGPSSGKPRLSPPRPRSSSQHKS